MTTESTADGGCGVDPVEQVRRLEAGATRDQQMITDLQSQGKLDREQLDLDRAQIALLEADHASAWDTISALQSKARIDRAVIDTLRAEGVVERGKIKDLETALVGARRIGAAIGILMASLRLTEDQAFAELSRAGQERGQKVRDLAETVLVTGALPDRIRR